MFECLPWEILLIWSKSTQDMSANKKVTPCPPSQSQRKVSVDTNLKPNEHGDLLMLEEIRRMKEELREDNARLRQELRLEIRTEIQKEMGEIKDSLGKIDKDLEKINNKVQDLEGNLSSLENNAIQAESRISKLEEERKIDKQTITRLETKLRQNCIKLRGIPEQENENLYKFLIPILADFVEEPAEQFPWEIDTLYRINSKLAKQRNLPRDVVIYCVRKQTKDLIIQQSFKKELIVEGRIIQIFKDIPTVVLKSRKEYSFLTDQLKIHGIPFRWDEAEGLTLTWRQKRHKIDSVEKAADFWKRNRKEIEKSKEQGQTGDRFGVRTRRMNAKEQEREMKKKEEEMRPEERDNSEGD